MRTSIILPILALTRHVLSQNLQYDPRTAKDCVGWFDVEDSSKDTCESTLRYFGINPTQFHAWNPSVGLDCQPWFNWSYCVITNETLENSVYYTTLSNGLPLASMTTDSEGWRVPVTKSDATTRTTSTPSPIPSPSSWKDIGCYVDNWNDEVDNGVRSWILDMRYGRDPEETVSKCKDKCYHVGYKIAGVKGGDECWCGNANNGTLAEDQKDCNMPCAGDAKTICGGKQRISVFGAGENTEGSSSGSISSATTASGTSSDSAARTSIAGETATASSGARRNIAMLWRK
ncbi:hypothetical protein BU25DRAFT_117754 [Macroventuria anomochaeta]|uniref:Uncharacterized protein n=1 Tax=Macroventuria anomochaeta TaxID=301207 RepID=A0ACB6RTZ4_9PLEO|nr:uncharacterized protein BU25DRAFT_117754 [Macroventuria anomochaeta]KAF2625263.1 hypothetical protein BU25DRAFT_117754 [Macroventuria anomochaeta]